MSTFNDNFPEINICEIIIPGNNLATFINKEAGILEGGMSHCDHCVICGMICMLSGFIEQLKQMKYMSHKAKFKI